jgi:hypothetical protein
VVYKFKDETAGVPIVEFCGLRSKMYSILLDDYIYDKKLLRATLNEDNNKVKSHLITNLIEDFNALLYF